MTPEHAAKRLEEFREALEVDAARLKRHLDRRAKMRERLKQEMEKEVAALNRIIKGEPPPDSCPLCKKPLACGWWCCGCKATAKQAKWLVFAGKNDSARAAVGVAIAGVVLLFAILFSI